MLRLIVAVAALLVLVKCSRKFGPRKTLGFASLIVIMIFPFTLASGMALPFLRSLWHSLSTGTRFVAVLAVVIGGYGMVKKHGAGNVMGWAFSLLPPRVS
jgi:hypothetical protein